MVLKVDFVDFWKGFNRNDNYFIDALGKRFDIEINSNPDVLIHSTVGNLHWKYNCLKIAFYGENIRPNLFASDYFMSFDYLKNHRNFRWPLYKIYSYRNPVYLDVPSKFCCAVISNSAPKFRLFFAKKLMERKRVDYGGTYLNNVGGPVLDKLKFISNYKFNIAFESQSYPGYTTEKIVQAKKAGVIPIYFGNPRIYDEFQRGSFINLHDFISIEDCLDYIFEVDSNIDLYKQIQSTPLVPYNEKNMWPNSEELEEWFESILSHKIAPTQKSRVKYFIYGGFTRSKTEVVNMVATSRYSIYYAIISTLAGITTKFTSRFTSAFRKH